MKKEYSCPYCLTTVLDKLKHEKSKAHIYNKANCIVINSKGKTKKYVSDKLNKAKKEGKCFHLFVENNKVADVQVGFIMPKNKNI